jgi:diguanylate cyclase (GGDEF)-like protein
MRQFDELLAPTSKGTGELHAVVLIDCDYFKTINDTLGHAAGDAVIEAIAARLMGLDRQVATAARLGGDEFALISTRLETVTAASELVRDIETVLMQPVRFGSRNIAVSVSIGADVFEAGCEEHIDSLLARADLALYRAKRNGRGCSRFYDAAIDAPVMQDLPAAGKAGPPAHAA